VVLIPVPSTYLSERLTPLSGGIRDGARLRVASPPPCPGSAAARSGAGARPWPTISVSGSCCSSARTPTGSASDAVQKRAPRLRRRLPLPEHVLRNRRLRHRQAQFQQLTVDLRRAPERIGTAHPPNQVSELHLDSGPSAPASTLPRPVTPEPLPVPPHHGLRPHLCLPLFVLSASCRPPPVFVMQSTDAPHLHPSALTRTRLGCVFRQR